MIPTYNLQEPPRIQIPYPRALRLPLKHKLTHQHPGRTTILNAPTRMPGSYEQARRMGFPDQGTAAAGYGGEVAGLLREGGAVSEGGGDRGDVGCYVGAAGGGTFDEGGVRREGNVGVCFAWEVLESVFELTYRGAEETVVELDRVKRGNRNSPQA